MDVFRPMKISRQVKELFSDNGTNSAGAERKLRAMIAAWNRERINPPRERHKVDIQSSNSLSSRGSLGEAYQIYLQNS